MSQVVSTKVRTEGPQADGRRWVHLAHTLDDGSIEESSTLIDAKATATALRDARVRAIEERPAAAPTDAFLTKLDVARATYLAGDLVTAEAVLGATTEGRR